MMQLMFGSYAWPAGGVKVTSSRKPILNAAGIPYTFDDAIECEGYIEGTGQNDLSTKQSALEAALRLRDKDLVFLCDDGSRSATCLLTANSITGVRITDGPHFQDVNGPEYVSQRKFKFTAEADYRYEGVNRTTLIDWSETLTFSGGGPLYITKPGLVGLPQRQMVYERTPCLAKQKGYAIGFGGDTAPAFPEPAAPIWPFALKTSPDATYTHPKRKGGKYTDWKIEWEYTFEWIDFLVGVPTLWSG